MGKTTKIGDAAITSGLGGDDLGVVSLDAQIQQLMREVQEPRQRTYLWGSDGCLCPRKNLFNQEFPQGQVFTPANIGYMAMGVALEDMLAKAYRKHGRLFAANPYLVPLESELIPKIKLRGKIDLVISDFEDQLALVEVKSCGPLPSKPKTNHVVQAETYGAVSGINRVYLTYISRKVSSSGWGGRIDVRTFDIPITRNVIYTRFYQACMSTICMAAKKTVAVDPTFTKSRECAWCPFQEHCWPIDASPLPYLEGQQLKNAKHLAINAAEELSARRPERYIATLEGLLLDNDSELLRREWDSAPRP